MPEGMATIRQSIVKIDTETGPVNRFQSLKGLIRVTDLVIPRLKDAATNLRTTFTRIITRAGLKPWPRLFHNMRASCATDWVERFPNHVVAAWLGHSPLISSQHYLQVRDAHFDLATSGTKSGALLAQNAAQHPSARNSTELQDVSKTPCITIDLRTNAN